jgi:hypothetical protein
MPGQVVLPAIEQVLQVQPGFGFALDGETALEKERVGVLLPARERGEIRERPADRHVRRTARMPESAIDDFEAERERNVLDAQAEAFAREFIEPAGEELAAQQLVDREREHLCLQRRRRNTEHAVENGYGIGQHDGLAQGRGRYSCHERGRGHLIPVNTAVGSETVR